MQSTNYILEILYFSKMTNPDIYKKSMLWFLHVLWIASIIFELYNDANKKNIR